MVSGLILLSDQVTKLWAINALKGGVILKPLGSDLLWFVLVHNPGLAFGVDLIPSPILTVVVLLASLGLLGYLIYKPQLPFQFAIPLSLVMGGAFGNLIDRLRFGYVIDFISVDLPDFIMDRWPVFNIADSAVSVGIITLLILNLIPMASSVPLPQPTPMDNDPSVPTS
ncbi:MAG: signal peptidase II, partial [bacterium]